MNLHTMMLTDKVFALEEKVNNLTDVVTKLQSECKRLYQQGYSDGVDVARKEFAKEENNHE